MKKGLVSVFILLTVMSHPKTAAAATCDRAQFDWGKQHTVTGITFGSTPPVCPIGECPSSTFCYAIDFGFYNCGAVCIPPKNPLSGFIPTKAPSCPPGCNEANLINSIGLLGIKVGSCYKGLAWGFTWPYEECDKNYCGSNKIWTYKSKGNVCIQIADNAWKGVEVACGSTTGIKTAIGCVPTGDLKPFLEFILKWVFYASGGIILLMFIATGYTLLTSQGNPEKLQAAKENIVALFSGLLLIVFSLVLLQAIGADILGLPGF